MNKILVVGPAWVGDMVMAQALFKVLHVQYPNSEIHVLAPPWTHALLQRMPEVAKGIVLPFQHGELKIRQRYAFAKKLRAELYTHAIVLPNSWKSALIPFWAHIPVRTGWRGEWRYGLLNDVRDLRKQPLSLMVERFLALGLPANTPVESNFKKPELKVNKDNLQQTLHDLSIEHASQSVLALCPGAEFGPSKRWPIGYFSEVARYFLTRGWQVWLFGSGKDIEVAQAIQQQTESKCINLVGKTSLAQAIDLLSIANKVLTNDSGLMHVAAALQRPLVAVFGSTSPKFTPPLSDNAKIEQIDLDCRPCFKRECPLGHHRCMKELSPQRIISVLEGIEHANHLS